MSATPPPPPWVDVVVNHPPLPVDADTNCSTSLLRDRCRFYHYGCDGVRDNGWGCGYRTLQTIVSWLLHRTVTDMKSPPHRSNVRALASGVPSLRQIQEVLSVANPAKRGHRGFVGSTEWISTEDSYIHLQAVHGLQCRIVTLAGGSTVEARHAVAVELAKHFDRGDGPVMIGGTEDNRSRACVGVCIVEPALAPSKRANMSQGHATTAWLLVLDPHFGGRLTADSRDASDNMTAKGAAALGRYFAWEPLDSLADGWHNICCPVLSLGLLDVAVDGRSDDCVTSASAADDDEGFRIVVESSGFDGAG